MFRLFMKGKLNAYLLWPLGKSVKINKRRAYRVQHLNFGLIFWRTITIKECDILTQKLFSNTFLKSYMERQVIETKNSQSDWILAHCVLLCTRGVLLANLQGQINSATSFFHGYIFFFTTKDTSFSLVDHLHISIKDDWDPNWNSVWSSKRFASLLL